jgi:hypothetical protein
LIFDGAGDGYPQARDTLNKQLSNRQDTLREKHVRFTNQFSLDIFDYSSMVYYLFRCSSKSIIGNPVKFGDGPAAVFGDERCMMPLAERLGRRSR